MEISLQNAGRRFNKEWIFRHIDYSFKKGSSYAILGPNGSGKSTLLSVLLSSLTLSEGEITYFSSNPIFPEKVYEHISFAAPYIDLVEEFTLTETINFHFGFKKFADGINTSKLITLLGLEHAKDKALKYFSSGMKQRTKLALACCSDTDVLILDEPTSNLDEQGIAWYHQLLEEFSKNRLLLIGSNQKYEYDFCDEQIRITDFKG